MLDTPNRSVQLELYALLMANVALILFALLAFVLFITIASDFTPWGKDMAPLTPLELKLLTPGGLLLASTIMAFPGVFLILLGLALDRWVARPHGARRVERGSVPR